MTLSKNPSKRKEVLFRILAGLFLLLVVGVVAVIGELVVRLSSGYSLQRLRLVAEAPATQDAPSLQRAARYVDTLPVAESVDRRWFELDPPPVPKFPASEDLAKRYWAHPGREMVSIYEWNQRFLAESLCRQTFPVLPDYFAFEPHDGRPRPRYRFKQNATLPSGLTTNAFGWRGRQIDLNRPAGTVRIAFVGASTTVAPHAWPFSYPEYIGHWLNVWADAKKLPIRFEIINAAREGTSSEDFSAIVRSELLAADPDIVVYYEGSNQFWPMDYVTWRDGRVPPKPERTFREPSWLAAHSATVRQLELLWSRLASREPQKPEFTVNWPPALNEFDPDITFAQLPVSLPRILEDLRSIKKDLDGIGATLAVSSFVWLGYEGMNLELPRQWIIYTYLNDTYWPFRYTHIRRLADFQNRVLSKFAAGNNLPFVDVARDFPQDPELFDDAIHMSRGGTRLHAWIAFQQLLPYLEQRIQNGTLPRPATSRSDIHLAFAKPAKLITNEGLQNECESPQQRDDRRISDLSTIQKVLEQYRQDNGHYPSLPPGFASWGQCSGGTRKNWLPHGTDYSWSDRYIEAIPGDPRAGCNYPFDVKHAGHTQYMYVTDGGRRYALIAGLEDPSRAESLRNRGADQLPQWFKISTGFGDHWSPGTLIVMGSE